MAFGRFLGQLRAKSWRHWFVVAVLLGFGVWAGDQLGDLPLWVGARYRLYQVLQSMGPQGVHPKRTTLVLIGDAEYWSNDLARRAPLRRDYLARLASRLDQADVAVLALDFDLRATLPPEEGCEYAAYQDETRMFVAKLLEIGARRTVVLPRTISFDENRKYLMDRTVFDCDAPPNAPFSTGYISLPYDLRRVPLALRLADGKSLDSFAAAIARAVDPRAVEGVGDQDSLPYGTFIRESDFEVLAARDVLRIDPLDLRLKLAHRIVIVGGSWHVLRPKKGLRVDSYLTPVGTMPGAFIHANYVEALLDSRTKRAWSEKVAKAMELLLSLFVAVIFALQIRPALKIGWVFFFCLMAVAFTYFSWQNLGLFFDLFVPVLLLGMHAIYEQVSVWQEDSHHLRERK